MTFSFNKWTARLARCGVIGALALASFLPMTAAAQDDPPDAVPAVASANPSPEGRQRLLTTLVLAGLLVGMERFCSWRLRLAQRRDADGHPRLASILPPLPAWSDTGLGSMNGQ